LLLPFAGPFLYALLGVNRIRRKAEELRGDRRRYHLPPSVRPTELTKEERFADLAQLVDRVNSRPLLPGNSITALSGGDEAYPDMLAAIDAAEQSVCLLTYIFDDDPIGREFAEALARAHQRGVAVRVLVDAAGAHYSWPPIDRRLRREGVPVRRFLPMLPTRWMTYFNLRNHRKIVVVDGSVGFAGGMNIRHGHWLSREPRHPVQDLHFRIEGPVVAHLTEIFAEDWEFTTGEVLEGDMWFPQLSAVGDTKARGIADGPDENFERIRWTMLGALACARRSVRLITPYFLPDTSLITALALASLRGVEVDIVLPARGNLRIVEWASWAQLWQVLERGCRVWLTPPPFDHTKLFVVDESWVLIGSANWDPRSLRLNFEFGLECYGAELAERMSQLCREKMAKARRLTLDEVEERSLPVRLRDGLARLLTPYL
ncbi:MAG TPA: phospholipase D-like domain-containing protein, partial [Polyangiaceae bacterium]|nr:phospholipase D-like domain-containing protein [Polyangiaceae bacterium]